MDYLELRKRHKASLVSFGFSRQIYIIFQCAAPNYLKGNFKASDLEWGPEKEKILLQIQDAMKATLALEAL